MTLAAPAEGWVMHRVAEQCMVNRCPFQESYGRTTLNNRRGSGKNTAQHHAGGFSTTSSQACTPTGYKCRLRLHVVIRFEGRRRVRVLFKNKHP